MNSYGDCVRNAREKIGMTQRLLAERTGIPRRTLRSIETGETQNPGILQMEAIAQALRLTIDELLKK